MKNLIYQGSVKNIFTHGEGLEFEFTNYYSIYDWGHMPDQIPRKGENLAKITSKVFEKLQSPQTYQKLNRPFFLAPKTFNEIKSTHSFKNLIKDGAKTHFIKYKTPNSIIVKPVQIIKPSFKFNEYDYSNYHEGLEQTLIPLEVVFRFGAPQGSSYLKRNTKVLPDTYFENIIIEFYTKLEPRDRLLTYSEAQKISKLTDPELQDLIDQTKIFALVLQNIFTEKGFTLWDGKFEFATGKNKNNRREIMLVDSIGPDELRINYGDFPYSKEFLRQQYSESLWAKNFKKENSRDLAPGALNQTQLSTASMIYEDLSSVFDDGEFKISPLIAKQIATFPKHIVIFGKGGREHAISEHLSQNPLVQQITVIPGNPGMQNQKVKCQNLLFEQYVEFCQLNNVNFTIIGPEDLVEKGLSNQLEKNNIPCMAPSQEAGKLETSKAFAKDLMAKYGIPTASYKTFKNSQEAIEFINTHTSNEFVVKLSALAGGKGVILCQTKSEAIDAIKTLAPQNQELVIEEYLNGPEVSYFALCMESEYKTLGTACDYKRLLDENKGPNTGGMGCYSPAHWLTNDEITEIENSVLKPTLKALHGEDIFFKGVLFIGLMMTKDGPKVLEYNIRFGDPETQTILPRLNSSLLPLVEAIAFEDMEQFKNSSIQTSEDLGIHIVKAAKGYPGNLGQVIEAGKPIEHVQDLPKNTKVFYAGIDCQDNKLITAGGRVLGFTTLTKNLESLVNDGYQAINSIKFSGEQYRKDIGKW